MQTTIDPAVTAAESAKLRAIYQAKKKELGLTQERIACEGLGARNQSTANHYMTGKSVLNLTTASVFSKYLQVPIEAFSPRLARELAAVAAAQQSGADDYKPQTSGVRTEFVYPIYGRISEGVWRMSEAEPEEKWPSSSKDIGGAGYWLKQDGDSMISPSGEGFPVNCLLLVDPSSQEVQPGKLYIFRTDNGQAVFRIALAEAGDIYLRPLNPVYRTLQMNSRTTVIGEVVDARIII